MGVLMQAEHKNFNIWWSAACACV